MQKSQENNNSNAGPDLHAYNIELSSRADSNRESQFCRQPKETVEVGIAADCSNDLLDFLGRVSALAIPTEPLLHRLPFSIAAKVYPSKFQSIQELPYYSLQSLLPSLILQKRIL